MVFIQNFRVLFAHFMSALQRYLNQSAPPSVQSNLRELLGILLRFTFHVFVCMAE